MDRTIGERIKERRLSLKLTLEEVAVLIGSGKSYVWELENKEIARPSAEKLMKLAEALQTSMSWLLGKEENFPKEDLRDKIAIAALNGICADGHTFWDSSTFQGDSHIIATKAYQIADAMLEVRRIKLEQPQQGGESE